MVEMTDVVKTFREGNAPKGNVMDKLFEETKVKMVMKLRGVSRAEAELIVNSGEPTADGPRSQAEEKAVRSSGNFIMPNIPDDDEQLISAEDFFGEV